METEVLYRHGSTGENHAAAAGSPVAAEENEKIYLLENEELKEQLELMKEKQTRAEVHIARAEAQIKPPTITEDYLQQLKSAQENLFQYNQHINKLLQQIQMLKESEKNIRTFSSSTVY